MELLKCRRSGIILILLLVVTFSWACSSEDKDQPDEVDKQAGDIRIMQYNIHFGVGTDNKYNIDRVVSVIKSTNADVIILNEVDKYYSERSLYMYMGEYMASKLNMNFVHTSSIVEPATVASGGRKREVGNVILTKYKLDSIGTKFFSAGDQWPRIISKSKITLDDGRILYVAVSHYGLNQPNRIVQANETLDFLKDIENEPMIFAGDLNAEPGTTEIGILDAKYQDAFKGNEWAKTFSSTKPEKRIDFIWGSQKIQFRKNAKTILSTASDHLPIVVDVSF